MKNLKIFISVLVLSFIAITSCQRDEYSLGDKMDPSEIEYEVIQDYDLDPGGNTVILKFNTNQATPVWNYGTGRSTKFVDTVRYAFKGEYTIDLNVITAGGLVDLEPTIIEVTDDNLNYVNDPLWTALSGGVGESKTWYLDLDENGVSKYFAGPQYFYGTDNGWLEGGDDGCYGDDCWNWNPGWSDNTWIMPAGEYGSITFSLDGGPYVTANHLMLPNLGEQSGTYFLDKDAHTLTLNDVALLHQEGNDACVSDWGDIRVFSLTEDTMQLGVLRKDECEGPAMLVYNFISKEYAENWVPEEPEPETEESQGGENEEGNEEENAEPTELAFDNSKLVVGDLEDNGNLRLELYNEYGASVNDPGLVPGDVTFGNSLEVTFTLDGVSLNSDAAGSYDAKIYFADSDWTPSGDGNIITVNGNGTYTLTYDTSGAADGALVFVIDVVGLADDVSDLDAVSATIDSVMMY